MDSGLVTNTLDIYDFTVKKKELMVFSYLANIWSDWPFNKIGKRMSILKN
jgi:type IV secretory pathway TrbF-like protein